MTWKNASRTGRRYLRRRRNTAAAESDFARVYETLRAVHMSPDLLIESDTMTPLSTLIRSSAPAPAHSPRSYLRNAGSGSTPPPPPPGPPRPPSRPTLGPMLTATSGMTAGKSRSRASCRRRPQCHSYRSRRPLGKSYMNRSRRRRNTWGCRSRAFRAPDACLGDLLHDRAPPGRRRCDTTATSDTGFRRNMGPRSFGTNRRSPSLSSWSPPRRCLCPGLNCGTFLHLSLNSRSYVNNY